MALQGGIEALAHVGTCLVVACIPPNAHVASVVAGVVHVSQVVPPALGSQVGDAVLGEGVVLLYSWSSMGNFGHQAGVLLI